MLSPLELTMGRGVGKQRRRGQASHTGNGNSHGPRKEPTADLPLQTNGNDYNSHYLCYKPALVLLETERPDGSPGRQLTRSKSLCGGRSPL